MARLKKSLPPAAFVIDPNEWRANFIDKGLDPVAKLPPGNLAFMRNMYNEETHYVDQWLNSILQSVRESGGADNTLVVFLADHGEQFMEHGDVKHTRQLYQPLVHVPLVLYGRMPPGLAAGTVVRSPHSTMELFPSLLDWAGRALPAAVAPRATLFRRGPASAPIVSAARGLALDLSANDHDLLSLRAGHDKLVLDITAGAYELYDLNVDPGEKPNLAPSRPERARELLNRARAIYTASGKNAPGKNRKRNKELERRMRELGYIK